MSVNDPYRQTGASIPALEPVESQGLDLMARPTLNIPIPLTAANRVLVGGPGILAGIALREGQLTAAPQTPQTNSSAVGAGANNVALAAGGAGVTTYVTGFEITGAGATAGSVVNVTLTNVIGGTKTYAVVIPAGAGVSITPLVVEFPPPGIPASAANLGIGLNVPSFGAGNTNAAATINGYNVALGLGSAPFPSGIQVSAELLDGLDSGGESLLPMLLPPFGVINLGMGQHGPIFTRGLFLLMNTGFLRGAVYVKI